MTAPFDLVHLLEWVRAGHRSVKIELGDMADPAHVSVWCYDYDLAAGAFVRPGEDIPDLRAKAVSDAQARLQRLTGGN